ncbi:hypothetical protein M8J76_015837 [Diaphorina citri]|nr:hypothetical protein M8J76_015837 [Diaphorina citri]
MIMTFMCLMMKIFQYSSSTNGNKASGPPYKLKNAANGKAPSKIPRAIGGLGVNRGESGTEEPSKLAAAPKKRFHKLRKIRNKIRKFGRYDNSGKLHGSVLD